MWLFLRLIFLLFLFQVEELQQQVTLQTELAEEYREIARDMQERHAELQKQYDSLSESALSPEKHKEAVEEWEMQVREKQRALDFASEEVSKMEKVWRDKVTALQQRIKDQVITCEVGKPLLGVALSLLCHFHVQRHKTSRDSFLRKTTTGCCVCCARSVRIQILPRYAHCLATTKLVSGATCWHTLSGTSSGDRVLPF